MLERTLLAAGLLAGVLAAAPVLAGPVSPLSKADVAAVDMLFVLVHGCHREPEPGAGGWHTHRYNPRTGDPCARFSAGPRRGYDAPQYFEPPRRRPVCFQDCNYMGPIKQCRTVCR